MGLLSPVYLFLGVYNEIVNNKNQKEVGKMGVYLKLLLIIWCF